MPTFYHATHTDNLSSIMIEGLQPNKCQDPDERQPYVFLDDRINVAEDFKPANGVILKIDVPAEVSDRFVYNEGEYIRSPIVIEPKYITPLEGERR